MTDNFQLCYLLLSICTKFTFVYFRLTLLLYPRLTIIAHHIFAKHINNTLLNINYSNLNVKISYNIDEDLYSKYATIQLNSSKVRYKIRLNVKKKNRHKGDILVYVCYAEKIT